MFKKLFAFLTDPKRTTGALSDTRPADAKIKDYRFEETVAEAAPVYWAEKPRDTWRTYPVQDQSRTFSCVAQTVKKMLGVWYSLKTGTYVEFSASHIYKRRSNRPGPGMAGTDALDIVRKGGVTLETLVPSNQRTDADMDAVIVEPYKDAIGSVFRADNYLVIDPGNIETIASIIQHTRKAVMVWFYFTGDEWARTTPVILNPLLRKGSPGSFAHSVAAVDYTLWEGKKALIIEDSAPFGGITQRVVTEDFFRARNLFAAYIMGFQFDAQISHTPQPEKVEMQKPSHEFTTSLQMSSASHPDVVALQNILKYEGLFPTNIASTGIYGAITSKAVLEFQRRHNVAPSAEIEQLAGRVVGPATRRKLNELY